MKKWLIRIAVALMLVVAALAVVIIVGDRDSQTLVSHIRNNDLATIKPDFAGNGVDQKDRFINDEFPYLSKTSDLIRWRTGDNPFAEDKRLDTSRLEVRDPAAFLAGNDDGILWLGHATFFIRLGGVAILTDPIFDTPSLIKRVVEVPSPLPLIRSVDYVLLSHDHRDHMDETTLRSIAAKFPQAKFLAGLRSEDVLDEWSTPTNTVHTAGWFQSFQTADSPVRIHFLPVRHWSRRFLLDTNWRLWGGYVIESEQATIYFGGDSGYGRHYRETGELFPEIDYFLIGIGAYEPRWFMEPAHNSPADAIKAFRDSGARVLVPMHYGTFNLSDEPAGAPLRTLLEEAATQGISDKIKLLTINESLIITP